MTLIADGDVPDPVIQACQAVKFEVVSYKTLGLPIRPDKALMAAVLPYGRVLVTRDTGIPSQAYLYEFAQGGLTVVLLRWKRLRPVDLQQMVIAILRDGLEWERIASQTPSIISVSSSKSRSRRWETIPPAIADAARG